MSAAQKENFFLGTQAIFAPKWKNYRIAPFEGHGYDEPDFDMLSELRSSVKLMGCNQFKFKLACNTCESYQLPGDHSSVSSLKMLAQVPEVAATLADPALRWYHIWTYSYCNPKPFAKHLTKEMLEAEYQETYDWAVHMLTQHQNSNKVFFVGNWEGDWELMWSSGCRCDGKFDFHHAPKPENVQRYVDWASTRQRAINDAKRDVQPEGVDMFYYIEFNLECENYDSNPDCSDHPDEPRPTILNCVVPQVNPDFLSYSSYKSTNKYINQKGKWFDQKKLDEKFWALLDFAESKLQDKDGTDFSSVLGETKKRVFIGEFGSMRESDPTLFAPAVAQVVRASLTWGCPFVLYWEVYDNDSETEPLVGRDCADLSTFSPLRQLFKDWCECASAHLKDNDPSDKEFRKFAISWFQKVIKDA